jgi:ATP-dependent DNA ligase
LLLSPRFWTVRLCAWTQGKPRFADLLFRRGEARFCAFDLLWSDGEDLRYMPLMERKWRLRTLVPPGGSSLLYCDHVENLGEGLFHLVCKNDLEGIVAKQKNAPYLPEHETTWFKVRNQSYSQWAGREESFERERGGDPDVRLWDSCVMACNSSLE